MIFQVFVRTEAAVHAPPRECPLLAETRSPSGTNERLLKENQALHTKAVYRHATNHILPISAVIRGHRRCDCEGDHRQFCARAIDFPHSHVDSASHFPGDRDCPHKHWSTLHLLGTSI